MKNLSPITLIISLCYFCLSCEQDIDYDNLLVGTWNYSGYGEDAMVFRRSKDFNESHCYKFNSNGSLTERKNSGWCGTPPISYADYSGKWTMVNDTLVRVDVGYWGGQTGYTIDIETLDKDELKIIVLP